MHSKKKCFQESYVHESRYFFSGLNRHHIYSCLELARRDRKEKEDEIINPCIVVKSTIHNSRDSL